MKFLAKTPIEVKTQKEKKRFTIADFIGAKEGTLHAWESKNCDCGDNVLRAGFGMEIVYCPDSIVAKTSVGLPARCQFFAMPGLDADGFATENIGALGDAGTLYKYSETEAKWKLFDTFASKMRAVRVVLEDGTLQTAFIGAVGLYLYTNGYAMPLASVRHLGVRAHLACAAQGRLFYVSGADRISYSRAYDPSNFTQSVQDGGSVQLPFGYGEIIDLVAFGDRVCVVYERGFAYVEITGDASNFTVRAVEYSGGKILPGSVGVYGASTKTLFFLAQQGVYKWSGNSIERVCKNLTITLKRSGQVCEHGFFEGKYIFTYYDEHNVRRCIVVDAETGYGYFATVPFGLSEYKGGALCYDKSFVRELHRVGALPNGEERSFSAYGLQWGKRGKKRLETLEIEGKGELEAVITADGKSKRFLVNCANGTAVIPVQMRGERFDIHLKLQDDTQVYAWTVYSTRLLRVNSGGKYGN